MYLQVLNYEKNQNLMQYSWNYMNDALRTDVFVRYQPETVACACIYLTARKLKLPLPKNPAWYTIFGASEVEIRNICVRILRLYARPKINVESLEKKVDELCKKYHDAKQKAKGNSGNTTPNNNSPSNETVQKTSGAHNAWGGFISRSGSHIPLPVQDKRSRSRSQSHSPSSKHHKRSKKHPRSRSRSPSRNHKKSHKRRSYSRSRSPTPHKTQRKDRREKKNSRSASLDRDIKNDRYIDRYDRRYEKNDKKYDKDREEKYKDDKYSSRSEEKRRSGKYRDDDRDRDREKERDRSKDRRR